MSEKLAVPVACYGTDIGDDFTVARSLAKSLNLPITEFVMGENNLHDYFVDATLDSDSRAETIDTPKIGKFHRALAEKYKTYINGDECFGWQGSIGSSADAFSEVGLRNFSSVRRLWDWLDYDEREKISQSIKDKLNNMIRISNETESNDLKDHLYYEQRMGNMLNAFTAQKLRFMEQARPLLDEDIIEFITQLPREMRDDKYLIRRVLETQYTNLMKIPLSTKDSIPTSEFYTKRLQCDKELSNFLYTQFQEQFDERLKTFINIDRVVLFLESVINGKPAPQIELDWWMKLPGIWRIPRLAPRNQVSPINLLLRLTQLNIYLRSVN